MLNFVATSGLSPALNTSVGGGGPASQHMLLLEDNVSEFILEDGTGSILLEQ